MKYLVRSQVEKIFYAKYKPFIEEFGFSIIEKKKSRVRKVYDWGWIISGVAFTGTILNAHVTYMTRINKVEEIVEKFIDDTGYRGLENGDFITFFVPVSIAWPEVVNNGMYKKPYFQLEYTEESVGQFFDLFAFTIKEKIIPTWEKWHDIKVLDKLLSESDQETASRIFGAFDDFFLRKIIITKLASNPDYEKIFSDTYELLSKAAETDNRYLSYLPVLEKLNEYLKTVEPLA